MSSRLGSGQGPVKKSKSKDSVQEEELEQILHRNGEDRRNDTSENMSEPVQGTSPTQFPRLVRKDGSFGWTGNSIIGRHHFLDIFTTLVEIQWRFLLLVFCVVYFGSWILFAVIWYALLYVHGDFQEGNYGNSSWAPCIADIKDFTGAFLFSVETQHTTGYGFYHLTEECSTTIITFCLQSIVGCILEGVMVGLIFVKITRGKKRTATLRFSKNAVISRNPGNGLFSFMFRIADLRNKSNLLEARIRAQLITWEAVGTGKRGDLQIGNYIINKTKMEVSADGEDGTDFLLFWPTTVVHHLTPSSPLHRFFSNNENKEETTHFEVIVVLEGISGATGQMTQARSSYVSSEVLTNSAFLPMTMTSKGSGAYEIDYGNFNEIIPVTEDEIHIL